MITVLLGIDNRAIVGAMFTRIKDPGGTVWWPEGSASPLHPALHGAEADALIAAAKSQPFLVCTHSDVFVMRLRLRVAEGTLAAADLRLVWVERDGTERPIVIDDRGTLSGWPKGVGNEVAEEFHALRRVLAARDEARARSGASVLEALAALPVEVPLHEPTPYSLAAALNVPTDIVREGLEVLVAAGFAEPGAGLDGFRITPAGRAGDAARAPYMESLRSEIGQLRTTVDGLHARAVERDAFARGERARCETIARGMRGDVVGFITCITPGEAWDRAADAIGDQIAAQPDTALLGGYLLYAGVAAGRRANAIGCGHSTQGGEMPARRDVARQIGKAIERGDLDEVAALALFSATLPVDPPAPAATPPTERQREMIRREVVRQLRAEGYLVAPPSVDRAPIVQCLAALAVLPELPPGAILRPLRAAAMDAAETAIVSAIEAAVNDERERCLVVTRTAGVPQSSLRPGIVLAVRDEIAEKIATPQPCSCDEVGVRCPRCGRMGPRSEGA